MKLHFEPDLDFQRQAIDSVVDLFHGQEIGRTEFTVTQPLQGHLGVAESDLGIGNRLRLLDDEILANLNEIQLRHGLRPSESLSSGDFTVEMETGTGKAYVYLRTIFELNEKYGFTKFVIVVPSVAIARARVRIRKAVLVEKDDTERLYFVVETKGSLFDADLRTRESAKIACGRAHFSALGVVDERPAEYCVARTVEDMMTRYVTRA